MNIRRSLIATIACAGLALGLPAGAVGADDDDGTRPPDLISSFAGDGGTSVLNAPRSVIPAPGSGYLVVDTLNNRIRKVGADGTISTVVGTGQGAFNGDGLAALSTKLFQPRGAAVTGDGGLLVADSKNHRIRKVAPSFGLVSTVVGTGAEGGLLGALLNGLLGTATELDHPSAVSAAADGSFLIADTENHLIRKIDPLGNMTTVAGTGTAGFSGDDDVATAAQLDGPEDVQITSDGGFLIADTGNHAIRHVDSSGNIATVAGDGSPGYAGDGGKPISAWLNSPSGIDAMTADEFWIADTGNHVIRKVKHDEIKTSYGDGTPGYAGDGGKARDARLNAPRDVLRIANGKLIVDTVNNRIRMISEALSEGAADSDPPSGLPQLPVLGGGSKPELPAVEAPKPGRHVQVEPKGGAVRVKMPNTGIYIALSRGASIPVGSIVDATRGRVALTSAKDSAGGVQRASFRAGSFKVEQTSGAKPVTELTIRGGDFRSCWARGARGRAAAATIAASRRSRARRRLWGSGKGRFRTRGRHGAATVRGTVWLTEDSCNGTRVVVRRGKVAVRSFKLRREVLVRAGRSFLAPSGTPARRKR